MDSERWKRVSEILAEVIELAADERDAVLAERCGPDEALRKEVEQLLAASETDGLLPADPDRPPSDPVGEAIGHYRVGERIGEGGMGRVYRGVDTRLGREVALKLLAEGARTDFHTSARFKREARVLASLNHPNIGAIYDLEEWRGETVLVLEYVEGPTLSERLAAGPLSSDEAVGIAAQIVRALGAAHERGIVHRDLKPGNVVLTPDGVVKVLDFGVAKPFGGKAESGAGGPSRSTNLADTIVGQIVGTPAYMSPEQIRGQPVDPRADIWAFGVTLFQMLAGVPPFEGEDASRRMARILEEEPAWQALPSTVPPRLRDLVERCLVKDPERRLGRIDEALSALEELTGEGVRPASGARPSRGLLPGALAAGVLLVLASAVVGRNLLDRAVAGPTADDPARVLVLPFQFLGAAEDAYLAEGVSEEISHRLGAFSNLSILGRRTAAYVSGSGMPPGEVGAELDADYVLDGTVRLQRPRDGPARLRVRAALTSTSTLNEVWSDAYEGSADDVFAVQAEVATRVAEAVGVELPTGRADGVRGTPDLQAYDYFLQGNEYSRRSELETSMRPALALYESAIGRDPDFAAAWAAASIMRTRLRWRGYDRSPENLARALEAGERALALDPEEAYGHLALGYYHYYGFRSYEPALEHFTAAAALRPNDPETHYAVGLVARRKGDWSVAVDALLKALRSDPRHSEVAITLGETFMALGRYEEADEYLDRAIAMAPDRPEGHLFKSWLRLASGTGVGPAVDAMLAGWQATGGPRAFALMGRYVSQIDWWLPRAMARDERYRDLFERVDLLALGVDSATHYLHNAQFHEALGRGERARAYSDSARVVLEWRVSAYRSSVGESATAIQSNDQASRLAHLALSYAGLGRREEALAAAEEGAALAPPGFDALHGSEVRIQTGLVRAMVGELEGARALLDEVFAEPSSFRREMLRHDPVLAPLVAGPEPTGAGEVP